MRRDRRIFGRRTGERREVADLFIRLLELRARFLSFVLAGGAVAGGSNSVNPAASSAPEWPPGWPESGAS